MKLMRQTSSYSSPNEYTVSLFQALIHAERQNRYHTTTIDNIMASFDISAARSKFPALIQDQVFLDNAGGSQTLGTVIESISQYLSNNNVQLGATYRVGKISTARYSAAFVAGAKYIHAHEDEIVFGSSTTQLFRNVSYSLNLTEGDEIVISTIDHEANIAPWVDMVERLKLVIKWWYPREKSNNPKLLAQDLTSLMSEKTRLVTCTHTSNILGTIHDIKAIAEAVHSIPGAMLCVDGVSYAPHRPVDVKDLGIDFYCFSWYKVYGPHVAMLYASRKAQEHMYSLGHFFNPRKTLDNKIGFAGGSYEMIQSIPAVLDYLGPPGAWDAIKKQEETLQSILLDYLNSQPNITVYGETSSDSNLRVATISFIAKGWNSKDLVEAVERDTKFGFRWGAFYSNRLVHEPKLLGLGPEGIVRVSMTHYNTVEEIKGFVAALDKVVSKKN